MKHRVGKTATGGYVVVDINVQRGGDRTWQTVTHETIDAPDRLSITGEHYERGDRRGEPSSAGQCVDSLDAVTEPAPGWTLEEVADLKALWTEWHLNDMQAGCAHQEVVWEDSTYGRRPSLEQTPVCPESGYRYGHAWLVKPLTDEVRARIARLDRDRSADLYKARGYDAAGKAV